MKSRPCIWMSVACLAAALTMTIQLPAQDNADHNNNQTALQAGRDRDVRRSQQFSLRRTTAASSIEQQRNGYWYCVYCR